MKKRVLMIFMAVAMTLSLTACGGSKEEPAKEASKVEEGSKDEEEETEEVEETEETEEKEDKKVSETPTLGNDVKGYDGFEYLQEYNLEYDGATAVVYAPIDEYASDGNSSVWAENYGVTVDIELEPYIQLDQEDYTMEENMEVFMEEYSDFDEDYNADYEDVEISEIDVISKEAAKVTVSRLEYDDYEEEYNYVWTLYYLFKAEDDRIFRVDIIVDGSEVTGYAEDLIAELETYFGFELGFDEEKMQEKVDNFDASAVEPSNEDGVYTAGYLTFELPEGWEEDPSMSDVDQYAYAPNGNVATAECAVMVQSEYVGEDTSIIKELEDDQLIEFLDMYMPEDIENPDYEVIGDTNMGYAVKTEFIYDGVDAVAYFAFDDEYIHTVMGMQYGSDNDAFDVAEHIVNTAETDY